MSKETVYQGRILTLEVEDGMWELVRHAPAVVVLALRDGKMLLVGQERRAIGARTLEAPAGLREPGETPERAARRELGEEASLDGDFSLVSRFYSSPGFCDEELHLFLVENLRAGVGERDEDEQDMTITWMEPQVFLSAVREGRVLTSAPTVAAALHATGLLASC